VRERGVEPPRLAALEPKDSLSAHEDTPEPKNQGLDAAGSLEKHEGLALAHPSVQLVDAVETALAGALQAAAVAGQWSVVAQLAKELEARRDDTAAGPGCNVVSLRARRDGGKP
jgi:hypothetical protein